MTKEVGFAKHEAIVKDEELRWKRGTINLHVGDDRPMKKVKCFTYGHLAVHRDPFHPAYYTITHIQSGFKMPSKIESCKNAKLIAERIHKNPHIGHKNLNKLPKAEFKKLGDLFYKSLKIVTYQSLKKVAK